MYLSKMLVKLLAVVTAVTFIGITAQNGMVSSSTTNANSNTVDSSFIDSAILKRLESVVSRFAGLKSNINNLLMFGQNVMRNDLGTHIDGNGTNLSGILAKMYQQLGNLTDGSINLQDVMTSYVSNTTQLKALSDMLTAFASNSDIAQTLGNILLGTGNSTGISSLVDEVLPLLGISDIDGRSTGIPGALVSFLGQTLVNFVRTMNISQGCINDTTMVMGAILDRKLWALTFVDAMGKPPAGILEGGLQWLGSFHQCLNVKSPLPDASDHTIGGNYCILRVPIPASVVGSMSQDNAELPGGIVGGLMALLQYGMCVPDRCSTEDVSLMINQGLMKHLPKFIYGPMVPTIQLACHQDKDVWKDRRATIVIGVLCGIGFLLLVGTLYDIAIKLYEQHNSSLKRIGSKLLDSDSDIRENVEMQTVINGVMSKNNGIADDSLGRVPSALDIGVHFVKTSSIQGAAEAGKVSPKVVAPEVVFPEGRRGLPDKTSQRAQQRNPVKRGAVDGILRALSLYANSTKMLNIDTKAGNLGSVNGVRFLSMSWVVLGHTYYFSLAMQSNLFSYGPEFQTRWTAQGIMNALVSVDSFFLLSGLLVAFLTLKEMAKRKSAKINWFMFYFHRFWRLTPPYMLILMVHVVLFKYVGSGPMWPDTMVSPGCTSHWWRNLLYINNFDSKNSCLGWTWYLANDMQFYVISPFILIPLFYSRIAGLTVLGMFFVANFASTGAISYINGLTPSDIGETDYLEKLYDKPWCRIGPYLVGLFVGYVLYKTKCKVKLHWSIVLLGWCVAAVCCLATLYGLYGNTNGHPLSVKTSAAYFALHRTAWGAGLGWVVFACCTGYGGVVNTFLSWKLFSPLARLTYCTYLVHPIVMLYFNLSIRVPLYLSDVNVSYLFVGDMVFSYAVAFLVSLAFEAPMIGLERVLLRRKQ